MRGIGTYLLGSRLDVKPLTILCGSNGAGKSTWLKAITLLKRSLASKRFPFGFSVSDWDPSNIQITNAFYHLAEPDEFERLADSYGTSEYGSPGTIGLEIHATEEVHLLS